MLIKTTVQRILDKFRPTGEKDCELACCLVCHLITACERARSAPSGQCRHWARATPNAFRSWIAKGAGVSSRPFWHIRIRALVSVGRRRKPCREFGEVEHDPKTQELQHHEWDHTAVDMAQRHARRTDAF